MASSKKKTPHGGIGNLNACKSVLPVIRRLQQGKPLPPELARVIALADKEADLLISDKGGLDNMSGGEQLLVNVWRVARQCTLLILHELIERGAVTVSEDGREWDLQPGLKTLQKFLSEQRSTLMSLGLARRAKNITDPATFLKERYGAE